MVNAVQPGLVETRSLALLERFKGDLFGPFVEWLKENFRQDVVMKAEDIAPSILRLCSFNMRETGQIVLDDRGVTAFVREHLDEFQELLRRTAVE